MIESNWPLVPVALFYLVCAIVGVIGNGIMVVVFWKESKFKLPIYYLITLNCLADLFHVSGHFVFNYQLFAEETSSQATCYFMLFHTAIGFCISGPLLLAIGIDRLIACRFPISYRTLLSHGTLYLCAQLLFPISFTVVLMIYGYQLIDYNSQIVCMAPLALPRKVFGYFTYASNAINVGIVVVYVYTYIVLRGYKERDLNRMQYVFKSISLTVIIVLIGWCTVTVGNTVAIGLIENRKTSEIVSIHAGFGVNISCSINIFVFYAINSEYRSGIRRLFGMKILSSDISKSDPSGTTKRMSLVAPATLQF
ncbi:CBN-SRSX-31 protein [Caenorhabditis brenneri]|uniref:CBN-SRSX-31 protein n=1 Tax=Caenorhabditis brenneri TaxID=135651 RepID=G0N8M4_CAEBE|nr:CBN-SRSX-31 protein [Caenorhabditis brenneri]